VGDAGNLITSSDGITWIAQTSGFETKIIRGVTYGDGLYVAVGKSGTLTTYEAFIFTPAALSLEPKSPVINFP
jgi:hypothetical protein